MLVALLVHHDALRVKTGSTGELLQHVGVLVVDHNVHFELAELAQLVGLLDENLLTLALHLLETSRIGMFCGSASCHFSNIAVLFDN